MATLYAAENIFEPMNVLWMYYFVQGNNNLMNEIWIKYLSTRTHLMFNTILHTARIEKNVELVEKLLGVLQDSRVQKEALGVVYSCLIDTYLSQGMHKKAVEARKRAIKAVGLENINKSALRGLKNKEKSTSKLDVACLFETIK